MLVLSYEGSKNNTFSVSDPSAQVFFEYDPMTNPLQAKLTGIVEHVSEDGTGVSGSFYKLNAEFQISTLGSDTTPALVDGGTGNPIDPWYGSNADNALYKGVLQDLLDHSNDTTYHNDWYSDGYDRIYFDLFDMELMPFSGPDSYGGPLVWDEAPTGPNAHKQFFFQRHHRGETGLSGVGWLDAPDQGNVGRRA